MAASSKIPLYLFQVLEEEYVALHAEDEAIPKFDWDFDASHIKDAEAFIAELSSTPKELPAEEDPDKLAKIRLINYLRITHAVDKSLSSFSRDDLVKVLNTVLGDKYFFEEERFSNYWLNNATRSMRDIHKPPALVPVARAAAGTLEGDDLKHFNRLLLEDAFPHYLEKIHRIRLAAIYKRIHAKKPKALCLSGGGIRSGTFALGLLQGLARHKLLDQFHYLSMVSGGGYIGSWLAAWIHRHPLGIEGVMTELANTEPRTKVDPDPEPLRYLRRYSSFITPKVGLLSADTWTFIGIYLRNLLLNWLVFIPLLLLIVMLPRLIVALAIIPNHHEITTGNLIPDSRADLYVLGRYVLLAIGFMCTVLALAYIMFNRPTMKEELREASSFWRRKVSQRYFLSWCLLPLSVAALSLSTYWAWSCQQSATPNALGFVVFGVAATTLAWLISAWVLGRIRTLRKTGKLRLKRIVSVEWKALLWAGLTGGVLLWAITRSFDFSEAVLKNWLPAGSAWTWGTWKVEIYACLAAPAFLLVFLLGATLYIGLSSTSPRVDDDDREWWARLSAWVLIVILAWAVFTTVVLFGPLVLLRAPYWLASLGGISGVLAAVAGRSAKTPGVVKSTDREGSAKSGIVNLVMGKVLPLLALIFIAFLLITLSLASTGIIQQLTYLAHNKLLVLRPYLPNSLVDFDLYFRGIYTEVPGTNYWLQTQTAHLRVLHLTSVKFILILLAALYALSRFFSKRMNLNLFSLHAGYRNRLIRAFLGASRADQERKPNPFTGFDPADNVSMHELRPGLFDDDDFPQPVALANALLNTGDSAITNDKAVKVSEYLSEHRFLENLERVPDPDCFSIRLLAALRKDLNGALQDAALHEKFPINGSKEDPSEKSSNHIYLNRAVLKDTFGELIKPLPAKEKYRLMPVINTTLNLVGGDNLAWQQRKAEPFSVSPLYSGCFRLGYRDSRVYGGRRTGGISIGTAAAISGAAASSNMGYYTTSPVLSLVLTFFNVRLGWWLGNPGGAGNDTFDLSAPESSVMPIVHEALGLTDDENKYVYLTDGGHFENLGLYEMVLRRSHLIVVSDAAADSEYRFSDLGNAIRKVRIDLGIPIEFTSMPIFRAEPGETKKGMYWAVGKIRYSCIDGAVDDGVLLYIKPAIYGDEPRDVLEYQKGHPTFPHQSTADQFFDEPQFESYRILGSHVLDQMFGSESNTLQLNEALRDAVAKLWDTRNGGPMDTKLKEWWEKLYPSTSQSQANQFWSLIRN